MKKTLTVMTVILAFTNSQLHAATLDFRVLIDGVEQALHVLSAGTHTLEIEGRVTDNLIGPNNDIPGGIISATSTLSDSGNALTFDEMVDGFGAGTNKWESTANASFDNFFPGELNFGGFAVNSEFAAISPPLVVADATAIGSAVFSMIFTGDFDYDGINDTTLSLIADAPAQRVADFTEGVISKEPEISNGTSTMITAGNGGENTPPEVTDLFPMDDFDQHTLATLTTPANYVMQATDAEDDDATLDWTLDSFEGPFSLGGNMLPGPVNGDQTLNSAGRFQWDPTGSGRGFYFAGVTVMDSGELTDMGILRVQVPEPSTIILAGLSLVGVFASRRRKS